MSENLDMLIHRHYTHRVRTITPKKLAAVYSYIYQLLRDAVAEQQELDALDFFASYTEVRSRQLAIDEKKRIVAELIQLLD